MVPTWNTFAGLTAMGAAGQGTAEAEAVAGRRATATESRSSGRGKDADEFNCVKSNNFVLLISCELRVPL